MQDRPAGATADEASYAWTSPYGILTPASWVAMFATRMMHEYGVTSEEGPDHQKLFTVEVMIGGEPLAQGIGLTKKAAEQAAARQALERISKLETFK